MCEAINCPLCGTSNSKLFHATRKRQWRDCENCMLVFTDPKYYPTEEEERKRYALHENDLEDAGYRNFLMKLVDSICEKLPASSDNLTGLDFGSGPVAALPKLMQTRGYKMTVYDPFFALQDDSLSKTYDFITCCEVAEHFHAPAKDFRLLDSLLRSGSWLAVMTSLLEPEIQFSTWHYPRDITHVVFYRRQTMQWIAQLYGWTVEFPKPNITIFQKLDKEISTNTHVNKQSSSDKRRRDEDDDRQAKIVHSVDKEDTDVS